jgi:parallel beta-helix repeat protein
MLKKIIFYFIVILIINSNINYTIYANYSNKSKTIFVDDDNINGPFDGSFFHPFNSISDGINHASTDDVIFVFSGIYTENLILAKKLSLIGEDKDTTIINGNSLGNVIQIYGDNIEISGFTIQNSGIDNLNFYAGIKVFGNNIIIYDNIITNCFDGISLLFTYKSKLFDNKIFYNLRYGLLIDHSEEFNIFNNYVFSNSRYGFYVFNSINGKLYRNNIYLQNNTGIGITLSEKLNISYNNIFNNIENGLYLINQNINCMIFLNTIINNKNGINIINSNKNYISENNIHNNYNFDAYFINCYNKWYNNYWNNTQYNIFPIHGKFTFLNLNIPFINFDWNPAKEPYYIGELQI